MPKTPSQEVFGRLGQLQIGGLDWLFGFLGSLDERDWYLGLPLETQTTGPQTTNLPLVDLIFWWRNSRQRPRQRPHKFVMRVSSTERLDVSN